MKKVYLIVLVVLILVAVWFSLRFIIGGNEDSWIKDDSWIKEERGVWIKHGNPAEIPDYVSSQQEAVSCANQLYQQKKQIMNFSSQCLGTCGNYAVDVVHVPRTEEDNLQENQCRDYREGKVSKFIELDKEGKIVRIM